MSVSVDMHRFKAESVFPSIDLQASQRKYRSI